jgi:hypothetical protein
MHRRMCSRSDDSDRRSSLAPLRWVAQEELLYERSSNTLHRLSCGRVGSRDGLEVVPAGAPLWLVRAPRLCECGPDVTLALGAERSEWPAPGAGT